LVQGYNSTRAQGSAFGIDDRSWPESCPREGAAATSKTRENRLAGDWYRPYFLVDARGRISAWPGLTAEALRVPADGVIGQACWKVLGERCGHITREACAACRAGNRCGAGDLTGHGRCVVLPLPGEQAGGIAWLPVSSIVPGPPSSAHVEGLLIRGALLDRLATLRDALDGIRHGCDADDCELFLLDPAQREVFMVECVGSDRDAFLARTHMPLGTGYPGTITVSRKPLGTNHVQDDARFVREEVKRRGIRSFVGMPVLQDGESLGYVGVGWKDPTVPLPWGLEVLACLSSIVPLAVTTRTHRTRARGDEQPVLELCCLGSLRLRSAGRWMGADGFPRRKAAQVLAALVLARGGTVPRDRLVERLWPEAPPGAGANRLHGVVNALRSALEPGRDPRHSRLVRADVTGYRLDLTVPHAVDLYDFVDAVDAGRAALRQGSETAAARHFDTAVRLYQGDLFANDSLDELVEAQRVHQRHAYLDAVRALVRIELRRGAAENAIWVLRAALSIEPVALDLHETLITQLALADRIGEAREQYESCCAVMRNQLDMEPSAHLRTLEQLLR
jgi:DNA-binding SARP family transcriptional activator